MTDQPAPRIVRLCTACPQCDHTVDETGDCGNGCHTATPVVSSPAAPTTPDWPSRRAGLRDEIADALAAADGWRWAPGFREQSPTWHGFLRQADAVLALLYREWPWLRAEAEDTGGACTHPQGYQGECPCASSCGCCRVVATPAVDQAERRARYAQAIDDTFVYATDFDAEKAADEAMAVADTELAELRAELEAAERETTATATAAAHMTSLILDRAERAEARVAELEQQPPADRAAVLLWAADQIDAETRQAKADEVLEPDKFRPCRDASAQLRRMAAEAQQPAARPESCAHCGKPIRRITGTLTAWWVHHPGGNTVCDPAQAATSPRATPKPDTRARCTCADAGDCFAPAGHYADCPATDQPTAEHGEPPAKESRP